MTPVNQTLKESTLRTEHLVGVHRDTHILTQDGWCALRATAPGTSLAQPTGLPSTMVAVTELPPLVTATITLADRTRLEIDNEHSEVRMTSTAPDSAPRRRSYRSGVKNRHLVTHPLARAIREAIAAGMTTKQVARTFDLSPGHVNKIAVGDVLADAGGPFRPKRPRLPPRPAPAEVEAAARDRLLERREVADNRCWLYLGCTAPDGYGRINLDGRVHLTHRLAYAVFVGPIRDDGGEVDHACHNDDDDCLGGDACRHRACFRPDHLLVLDHAEHVRRGRSWTIHGSKTHCRHGHPYDEKNTRYKKLGTGKYGRVCRQCARTWASRCRQRAT